MVRKGLFINNWLVVWMHTTNCCGSLLTGNFPADLLGRERIIVPFDPEVYHQATTAEILACEPKAEILSKI